MEIPITTIYKKNLLLILHVLINNLCLKNIQISEVLNINLLRPLV